MAHKPKTPEELALQRNGKKTYSLYLQITKMDAIKKMAEAANVSASEIVDEAIASYVNSIRARR